MGLKPDAEAVRKVASRLKGAFHPVDTEILSIGNQLGAAIGLVQGITDSFEALPQEMEGEALAASTGALRGAAATMQELAAALRREHNGFAALTGKLVQVGATIGRLEGTIRALSVLSLNSRIVATGIEDEGDDLNSFSRDITALVATGEAAVRGYRSAFGRLSEVVRNAAATQGAFSDQHGATLHLVARQIEESLQGIAERRDRARMAALTIGDRGREIGGAIGVVVMALQVGDSTRQRLEHVSDTLGLLADGRAVGCDWASGLSPAEQDGLFGTVACTQAAQLRRTGADLATEVARITGSLHGLGQDSAALVAVGTSVYGEAERGSGSFLAALERSLAAAAGLVQECQQSRGQVDEAIEAIDAMLRDLIAQLRSVRDIEADMRLVGLNATFKCLRLGNKGRALNVIARELRGYAWQTVECVNGLFEELRGTLDSGAAVRSESEALRADDLDALLGAMAGALGSLRGVGQRMDEALDLLDRNGQTVGAALATMAAGLPVTAGLVQDLSQDAGMLEAAAGEGGSGTLDPALLAERLTMLGADRYTMASEREIHNGRQRAAAPAITAAAGEDLEDIFF